jgi:predicted nucleic acid-binding protein
VGLREERLIVDTGALLALVDAAVVAAAERLGAAAIATTDRRHFSVVRPLHVAAFELPLLD